MGWVVVLVNRYVQHEFREWMGTVNGGIIIQQDENNKGGNQLAIRARPPMDAWGVSSNPSSCDLSGLREQLVSKRKKPSNYLETH